MMRSATGPSRQVEEDILARPQLATCERKHTQAGHHHLPGSDVLRRENRSWKQRACLLIDDPASLSHNCVANLVSWRRGCARWEYPPGQEAHSTHGLLAAEQPGILLARKCMCGETKALAIGQGDGAASALCAQACDQMSSVLGCQIDHIVGHPSVDRLMKSTEFVTPAKSPLTSEVVVGVVVGVDEDVLPPQAANSNVRDNSIAVIKLVFRVFRFMSIPPCVLT